MRLTIAVTLLCLLLSVGVSRAADVAVVYGKRIPVFETAKGTLLEGLEKLRFIRGSKSQAPSVAEFNLAETGTGAEVRRQITDTAPGVLIAIGPSALSFIRDFDNIPVVVLLAPAQKPSIPPGGAVTIIDMSARPEDWLRATAAAMPLLKRVGVLYGGEGFEEWTRAAEAAARRSGIELTAVKVSGPEKVHAELERIAMRVNVLWMLPDQAILTQESIDEFLSFGMENSMPVVVFSNKYLRSGGALAVVPDIGAMGRQAARLAVSLLEGGGAMTASTVPPEKVVGYFEERIFHKLGIDPPAESDFLRKEAR